MGRTICTLAPLPPGTYLVEEGEVVVHVTEARQVLAAPSRCQHAGARFGPPEGCVLTCSFHGWQLDASKMRYLPPHGDVDQPRYEVDVSAPDRWIVREPPASAPWSECLPRRALIPRSFTARFHGGGVQVRAGAAEVAWPGSGRVGRWLPLAPGARFMWLDGADELLLLVELAGHRILVARGELVEAPRDVDVLVALGELAEVWAQVTAARLVASDRPKRVRRVLRGTPVWEVGAALVLDIGSAQPV